MGIWARYGVETSHVYDKSRAREILILVESAVTYTFGGKGYSWAVIGFTFGNMSNHILDIYCGGECTDEWMQEDQFKDWAQSIDGLCGEPMLDYFNGGSYIMAMSSLHESGSKWAVLLDLRV